MSASKTNTARHVCHLEWFINSKCDYACKRCTPESQVPTRPDIGLDACMEALHSFVDFATERKSDAQISFYPRQAEFTEPFTRILKTVHGLKKRGAVTKVTSVTRGDFPSEKIQLYRETGVDACRLTIDGPEEIQDTLRREGSFRDTLAAFRETRDNGIAVAPVMILVKYNAPYVAETMRLMLDEGFDSFAIQVGIRGDTGGDITKGVAHTDSKSLWNFQLSAAEYREILLAALNFLDSVGERHNTFRKKIILENQMFARIFFEMDRWPEYEKLAGKKKAADAVSFMLKPDGSVLCQNNLPVIGSFPGGSFKKMFAAAHPMHLFPDYAHLHEYRARKQQEFAKCRACPAARYCKPALVGSAGARLFYQPDVHCWVDPETP